MSKLEINAELRELFPNDAPSVRMGFALALWYESNGETEKAEDALDKAIEAELRIRANN
jgi:hypothetical protein